MAELSDKEKLALIKELSEELQHKALEFVDSRLTDCDDHNQDILIVGIKSLATATIGYLYAKCRAEVMEGAINLYCNDIRDIAKVYASYKVRGKIN